MPFPRALPEHDVLVFEHIPKTAGTTFRRLLQRRFEDGLFTHRNVFSPQPRDGRLNEYARGSHFDPQPGLDRLEERIRTGCPPRAISAHIGYGFHERLPGDLRYVHFTFLRNPVQRTLSHYYYDLDRGSIREGTSLLEFCGRDAPGVYPLRAWNFQTTFLSGLRVRALLDDQPPQPEDHAETLLDAAVQNLDTFPALGLVERFEESLLLFGHTFGWPLHALCYISVNKGTRRPRRPDLTGEERAVLERVNRLDFELYRYAEERFERLLAERVPDMPARLRAFRRMNRAYRPILTAADRIERAAGRVRRARRALSRR